MIKYIKAFNKTLKERELMLVTYAILFLLIGQVIGIAGTCIKINLMEILGLTITIIGIILILIYMYNEMKDDVIKFFKDVKDNIKKGE